LPLDLLAHVLKAATQFDALQVDPGVRAKA
jgi:hypothetical protein